ncbi:MAG: chloride channel protein, partial [Deltaproteobacteria bacterium]|nr:chloride channel protein [Deltaproteobacteria bacterium]
MNPLRPLTKSSWSREQIYMLALAVVVGLLGGWGAVGFRYLIGLVQELSYGSSGNILEALANYGWTSRLLIPAAGGAVVGPMIYFLAREAKGHGVPEVMDAVVLKGG